MNGNHHFAFLIFTKCRFLNYRAFEVSEGASATAQKNCHVYASERKFELFFFPRTFAEILIELLATRNLKKLPLHIFLNITKIFFGD